MKQREGKRVREEEEEGEGTFRRRKDEEEKEEEPYQSQAPHQGSKQHQQATLVPFHQNQEVKDLHWSTESQGESQELKQSSEVNINS